MHTLAQQIPTPPNWFLIYLIGGLMCLASILLLVVNLAKGVKELFGKGAKIEQPLEVSEHQPYATRQELRALEERLDDLGDRIDVRLKDAEKAAAESRKGVYERIARAEQSLSSMQADIRNLAQMREEQRADARAFHDRLNEISQRIGDVQGELKRI